jgi:hypothetical protein
MTVRTAAFVASAAVAIGALSSSGCITFLEIPVEIPIQSKIDVSNFKRVLVAGFLAGGSKSIDPNTETARLLRSQLRSKSDLKVIDADVLLLADEFDKRRRDAGLPPAVMVSSDGSTVEDTRIKTQKDMELYEAIFADEAFWKKLGEEYQSPLIVTGSMLFSEVTRAGMVSKLVSYVDEVTKETKFREEKSMSDLKGYALDTKFVFIDGRTGKELHSEVVRDATLYPKPQNTPALSSYFELMDKILPTFLNTLSTQKIRGTRILIK